MPLLSPLQQLESDLHVMAASLETIQGVPPAMLDDASALSKQCQEFALRLAAVNKRTDAHSDILSRACFMDATQYKVTDI